MSGRHPPLNLRTSPGPNRLRYPSRQRSRISLRPRLRTLRRRNRGHRLSREGNNLRLSKLSKTVVSAGLIAVTAGIGVSATIGFVTTEITVRKIRTNPNRGNEAAD